MRGVLTITFSLLAMAFCYGQQQEQSINQRLKLQMDDYRNGKSSPMNSKAFVGSSSLNIKGSQTEKASAYLGAKKFGGADSFTTRSFFGLKNPWFGKKVYSADSASLLSKSLVANADKKYEVSTTPEKAYKDAKKQAQKSTPVVGQREFIPEGSAQGALDQAKANKNLSIDDVRSILNKNR